MDDKADILIVDDLPEKLLVYESVLEDLGQNVVRAGSGAEALKHVLDRSFAVILLDVNMPGMDGLETAALIRKRKKSAHTPIIFITSYLDEVQTVQGYAHGAVDYILAPVTPDILRAKVKVFVDLYRMHQQVSRQAQERVALAEERAKRAAAEEAGRSATFLAEASRVLANSMEFEATLRAVARLAVPFLADVGIACLPDGSGRPGRFELAWSDSSGSAVEQSRGELAELPGGLLHAIERVLTTGRAERLAPLAASESIDVTEEMGKRAPALHTLDSAIVLPLAVRGTTLGALALGLGPSGRSPSPRGLALADDLACRAGIALDNALLVRGVQEADRRKDEFLAMLAHELRNPIAPIRNAVHVLRLCGSSDPEMEKPRAIIDRQLRQLTRLVDDLLDVSRITRGKICLQLEPVNVRTVVTSAVETSRPLIEARKHQLTVSLPQEPVFVNADRDRLSQVLSNLLNNAAKYTESGGSISVQAEQDGEEAVFRVRDTGAGIPPSMLPHIFDLFIQVDQSLDRSQGGLGIGLTLVRRLVEMHGGKVQASSEGPGQGSEFVVRLPLENAKPRPALADNGAAVQHAADSRCRVLVVDDNVDAAETLAMLARLYGHEVRIAHTGPSGLETARNYHPEIVLLDIGLPGLDGYEVARRLRNEPGGDQILLVAVTGYGREEDRARARAAGFDHHLMKPFDPASLGQFFSSRQTRASERPSTAPAAC